MASLSKGASLRNKALLRRLAAITEITRRKVSHRDRLRDRAKGARAIRLAALKAKIDPVQIPGLKNIAYTPSQLAQLGVTPESDRADAEFLAHDRGLTSRWNRERDVAGRVPRFHRSPPHGRGASLDDWYAWALAQQRRQADPGRLRREPVPVRLSEFGGHRWRKRATHQGRDNATERMRRDARHGVVSRFAAWVRSLQTRRTG